MIKANQKTLLAAIKAAGAATDHKSSMPILANLLLTACDGVMTLRGTDLTTEIVVTIPCDGEIDITVNAKDLADAVTACAPKARGKAPASDVRLDTTENGYLKVAGPICTMQVVGLPSKDYPTATEIGGESDPTVYPTAKLMGALEFGACASSTDVTRYHLCGVFFCADKVVSTDGHRLHLESGLPRLADSGEKGAYGADKGYIVPRGAALTLLKVLKSHAGESVTGAFTKSHVAFYLDAATVTIKLVDAMFPPYSQVIPANDNGQTVQVTDRASFAAAVKAARTMSSDRTSGVRISLFPTGSVIEADNPDRGDASAPFLASPRVEHPFKIGVNGTYLLDFLSFLDAASINVFYGGELDPIKIESGERTAVVMPMRI
jgi:DNA polymerase-3 subunit beta